MNKFRVKHLSFVAVVVVLASCKKDDDQPNIPQPVINEPESITSVELHFTSLDGASSFRVEWDDPDGVGGNAPLIDSIALDSGKTYNVEVSFFDRSGAAELDLTSEILEEGNEHIVCFSPNSPLSSSIAIASTDSDGSFPIGLTSQWMISEPNSGTLTLILKHQPDGIKDGTCAPGDTDVEVLFPISIQ